MPLISQSGFFDLRAMGAVHAALALLALALLLPLFRGGGPGFDPAWHWYSELPSSEMLLVITIAMFLIGALADGADFARHLYVFNACVDVLAFGMW